jgi:hypothetical protein
MSGKEQGSKSMTLRIPDKAVIAIVLALAGFIWNKWESSEQKATNVKVENVMFEHLQSQIDDLREDVRRLSRYPRKAERPIMKSHRPTEVVEEVKEVRAGGVPVGAKITYDDIRQYAQAVRKPVERLPIDDGSTDN